MPIFEYECIDCGKCFEMIRFSSDHGPITCTECASKHVKRLISCTNKITDSIASNCNPGRPSSFS